MIFAGLGMHQVVKVLCKQPDKERELRTRTKIRCESTLLGPPEVCFDCERGMLAVLFCVDRFRYILTLTLKGSMKVEVDASLLMALSLVSRFCAKHWRHWRPIVIGLKFLGLKVKLRPCSNANLFL